MFDQSFSAKNFRKIFDYENRKGVYLEGRFFPELEPLTNELKNQTTKIREFFKNKHIEIKKGTYEEKKLELYDKRLELKKTKETRLMECLENVSIQVNKKSFSVGLQQNIEIRGKNVYSAGKLPEAYFALKQVQYNIRRLYKVRQSNRHHIVCQLRELLSDKMPKFIIRTDISEFYESIPRSKLLKKLEQDSLLTLTSKKIIKRILRAYEEQSGKNSGLPRGIGLSAYLSELFMRQFDEAIRSYPGVLYYARYVDDIFIMFIPRPNQGVIGLLQNLAKLIKDNDLKRNREKTTILEIDGRTLHSIDYLGYTFDLGKGCVDLSFTQSKESKYKERISLAFDTYSKMHDRNDKLARKFLVKRIKFLTGNTRLVNNKKNVVVGIYFSNSLLTSSSHLENLDLFLKNKISSISSESLKSRLLGYSFVDGFKTRRFHRFSPTELKQIVQVWKNGT